MRDRLAVHLSLRWGDVLLRSTSAPPSRLFVLGRGGDWPLPPEVLGAERFELLRPREGTVVLAVPPRATAWVEGHASPFRSSGLHRLTSGCRGRIEMGLVSVDLEVGPAEPHAQKRTPLPLGPIAYQGASCALHAGMLALLALLMPRLDAGSPDAEQYADRVAFLVHALDGSVAPEGALRTRPADDVEPARGQGGDGRGGDGGGTRSRREEGSPDSPVSTAHGGRRVVRGPPDEADAHVTREQRLRDAATYGVVAMLPAPVASDADAPASVWGRDSSQGRDAASASASLWGSEPVAAFTTGGRGLSGTAEGGAGEGIAIGAFGTLGHRGRGMEGGMEGRITQGRTFAGRCRGCEGDGVMVTGRLPPEVIQRIVRQSFGRFRYCYEKELDRNPILEAHVTTRFVIGRDGSVAAATTDGPAPLAGCVRAAFLALSFPEPAGGTVSVEYPLALQPD